MPATYTEHLVDIQTSEATDIELSPYQTQLNRVYRIASPVLENIYSLRTSTATTSSEKAQTVEHIDKAMGSWYCELPSSLHLDQHTDLSTRPSLREKLHHLQSLSLRLTYLNLMIIIHRPLLVHWRHRREEERRTNVDKHNTNDAAERQDYDAHFEQCLSAALAISRLGQEKPNLVLLASKTHLLSFLAMNIFTSSVVLFICAMSDVLSNVAQEAKRGMSRNLKILKSVASAGSLSSQCSMIVEDLVQMILEKEKDEMFLGPVHTTGRLESNDKSYHYHDHQITVPTTPTSGTPVTTTQEYDFSLHTNGLSDAPGVALGSTMEQLHKGRHRM